jgi:TM2 domain-containing membrane protein YozV
MIKLIPMKKLFSLSLLLIFSLIAHADTYKLNDAQIDQMFEQSTDITSNLMTSVADLSFGSFAKAEESSNAMFVADKQPIVAFLLAFFLGGLGIHRFYLGTKTMTGVGYILTCGGFGIVAFVDWILLLIGTINDDIDKYIDNPKFFMW